MQCLCVQNVEAQEMCPPTMYMAHKQQQQTAATACRPMYVRCVLCHALKLLSDSRAPRLKDARPNARDAADGNLGTGTCLGIEVAW